MNTIICEINNSLFLEPIQYLKTVLPGFDLIDNDYTPLTAEKVSVDKEILNYIFDFEPVKQKLNSKYLVLIEKRVQCGINTINTFFPLCDGEDIIEMEYSYLKDDYRSFHIFTPVIIRKTNYATVAFIFDNALWEDNGVKLLDIPYNSVVGEVRAEAALKEFEISEILSDLALSVVKGFLSKIGVKVFDSIFGKSECYYFDQLYLKLEKMVEQKIVENDIHMMEGLLISVRDSIIHDYNVKKENGVNKDLLIDILNQNKSQIMIAIGNLRVDNYKLVGFPVFMLSVYQLILILQELYLITDDPVLKKSYYSSIISYAADYKKFAESTYDTLKNNRFNKFTMKEFWKADKDGGYKWCDDFTNTQRYFYRQNSKIQRESIKEVQKRCEDDMIIHRNEAMETLKKELVADEFIEAMNKLTTAPVPIK